MSVSPTDQQLLAEVEQLVHGLTPVQAFTLGAEYAIGMFGARDHERAMEGVKGMAATYRKETPASRS